MSYEAASYRTKKALATALKNKMKEKPFSKITVSELIAVCGVNRKTFYYHFKDIYDLLRWLFQEETLKILKQFDLLVDYEDAIGFILDYIRDNKDILQCAHQSFGRDALNQFFYSDLIGTTEMIVSSLEKEQNCYLPEKLKQYYCDFLTGAVSEILLHYVVGEYPFSRQESIENIAVIVQTSICGLLKEKGGVR